MKTKTLLLCLVMSLFCSISFAQFAAINNYVCTGPCITRNLDVFNTSIDHYNEKYTVVGNTAITSTGQYLLTVSLFNANGTLQWVRYYQKLSSSINDVNALSNLRVFGKEIVACGISNNEAFILSLDVSDGSIIRQQRIKPQEEKQLIATDVIRTLNERFPKGYLLLGFETSGPNDVSAKKVPVYMQFDSGMNPAWRTHYTNAQPYYHQYEVPARALELKEHYYITGSTGFTSFTDAGTGILILGLDFSGNIIFDQSVADYSFNSGHQTGVDLVYDERREEVFLLGNDSRYRSSVIVATDTKGNIHNVHAFPDLFSPSDISYPGTSIELLEGPSSTRGRVLTITGYVYDEKPSPTTVPEFDAIPYIAKIHVDNQYSVSDDFALKNILIDHNSYVKPIPSRFLYPVNTFLGTPMPLAYSPKALESSQSLIYWTYPHKPGKDSTSENGISLYKHTLGNIHGECDRSNLNLAPVSLQVSPLSDGRGTFYRPFSDSINYVESKGRINSRPCGPIISPQSARASGNSVVGVNGQAEPMIYPNPVTSRITLSFKTGAVSLSSSCSYYRVILTDELGRSMLGAHKIPAGQVNGYTLEVGDLPPGMYSLQLCRSDGSLVKAEKVMIVQ